MASKKKDRKSKNGKQQSQRAPACKKQEVIVQCLPHSKVSEDNVDKEHTMDNSSGCKNGMDLCTHSVQDQNAEPNLTGFNGIAMAAEGSIGLPRVYDDESTASEKEKEPPQPMQIKIIISNENTLTISAMPSDLVAFVLQSILDQPNMVSFSCSGLYYQMQLLKESQEIGSVVEGSIELELHLMPLDYNERDIRIHLMRVRNLLFHHSSRICPNHFALDSGISLFKKITEPVLDSEKDFAKMATDYTEHDLDFSQIEFGPILKTNFRDEPEIPETLVTLSISGWNPSPAWRRIRGDFLYLQATFSDSDNFHITATSKGFFKNKSTNCSFDATADSLTYHSLLDLLSYLSSVFAKDVKTLIQLHQSELSTSVPETIPMLTSLPASNWLVHMHESKGDHLFDPLRGLGGICGGETVLNTTAMDSIRDWNDELQLYRSQIPSLEPDHPQQQQDQQTSESTPSNFWGIRQYGITHNHFVHTAIQGAVGVLSGSILPIALPDSDKKEDFFYFWNNLIFSFAEANAPKFKNEGHVDPQLAARVHAAKDLQGIQNVEALGIKGLHTMPLVIIDLQGHRILAQCLIPGIIGNPNAVKIVYGSLEDQDAPFGALGNRQVKSDPEFHTLVGELATKMMWKEHTVVDEKTGETHSLYTSAETRGVLGHDGRKYLFDLARSTPLDKPFLDMAKKDSFLPYLHDLTLIRYELLSGYHDYVRQTYLSQCYQEEKEKKLDTQKSPAATSASSNSSSSFSSTFPSPSNDSVMDDRTSSKAKSNGAAKEISNIESDSPMGIDLTKYIDSVPQIAFNTDQFTPWCSNENEETEELTLLYQYLYKTAIPSVVDDIGKLLPVPASGLHLTNFLHSRGISMRHLGTLLTTVETSLPSGRKLPSIRSRLNTLATLLKREMCVRAFKHIVRHYLKLSSESTIVIAHLFTTLLSINHLPETTIATRPSFFIEMIPFPGTYTEITPETLCSLLLQQVTVRFRYHLNTSFDFQHATKHVMLRECCLRLGVQLKARSYGPNYVISEEDVVNIVPVVKSCQIKSPLCHSHLELAQSLLQSGQIGKGLTALEHAFYMFEQSFSPIHADTLLVQTCIADVYHSLYNDQKQPLYLERALELQRNSVIGFERLTGLDSYETASAYHVLAAMEFTAGQFGKACVHLKHSGQLYQILYGPEHPDWIPHLSLFARIYEKLHRLDLSVHAWTLLKNYYVTHFGADEAATASSYFHLSQYVFAHGQHKEAVTFARNAYMIWMAKFGLDDYRTKEARQLLNEMSRQMGQSIVKPREIQSPKKNVPASPPTITSSKADLTIEEQLAYINGDKGEKRSRTPTSKKSPPKFQSKSKKSNHS